MANLTKMVLPLGQNSWANLTLQGEITKWRIDRLIRALEMIREDYPDSEEAEHDEEPADASGPARNG